MKDAINDLRNEGIEFLEEIAADYGLNAKILAAEFEKQKIRDIQVAKMENAAKAENEAKQYRKAAEAAAITEWFMKNPDRLLTLFAK